MPKTAQKRYQDALDYIVKNVSAELAQHIDALLTNDSQSVNDVYDGSIGAELSLSGSKSWYYARTPEKRNALRALLLCQNVYFSKKWYQLSAVGGSWAPTDKRADAKFDKSLEYWRNRSELEIREAIKAFIITNDSDLSRLVSAARDPGDDAHQLPYAQYSRTQQPTPGNSICYTTVTHWMLQSGLVSYRWMLRYNCGSIAPTQLKDVFGPAETIWKGDKPFGKDDRLPIVPAGMIVHIYVNQPYSVAGHWLVSTGDGKAYGRNNDDEDGLANRLYALCDLNRQFLAFKQPMPGKSGAMLLQQGQADVIDPSDIPNRI